MNQQAPYVRATDTQPEEQDPIFHFDALMGKILNALAVIGAFSAFIAACFFWGYLT